jgi:hypothetical protein
MIKSKFSRLCAFALLGAFSAANATTLDEAVQQLTGEAAQQYVLPIVSGFGANLNAGWYHKTPPPKKFGFSFEAGAIAMGTLLSGGKKTFDVNQAFRLDSAQASDLIGNRIDTTSGTTQQQQAAKQARKALIDTLRSQDFNMRLNGPTVIGSTDSNIHIGFKGKRFSVTTTVNNIPVTRSDSIPDTTIAIKGSQGVLGDFSPLILPLVAPQITVGTIYGTNLTVRWLPTMAIPKIGDFDFFGFGIQHNPAVWLNKSLPVDVCVGYFHQNLTVGDLFDASTNAYGVDVSKQLGWRILNITPYAGLQLESSTMSFHYDFTSTEKDAAGNVTTKTVPVKFDLDGDNSYRATVGVSLRFLVLNINADYNFAQYNSFSGGVMFAL